MKIAEFEKVKGMTYAEYCDYLQKKYGIGRADYMTRAFNKNKKVTSKIKQGLLQKYQIAKTTFVVEK